ncbi:MAG: YggS family pyridoxal phosphate-dependent enzyme [Paludibacter sp.]|nr:YggS family pyridoxal phosphate-dependent enzyme [Paludibacter sp.]
MSIQSNIQNIRQFIPADVKLVCVSKYHPNEAIEEAYSCGERVFGESKVQEMCGKYEMLPKDIEWHFIGHLQSNKIKSIVPFVSLIHGVDSFKLLTEINKHAEKANRKVNCLLQVHIAQEETKFGFSERELIEVLSGNEWKNLKNVQICGLMGMATFSNSENQVRAEFKTLKNLFSKLKADFFPTEDSFKEISMGMSADFKLAIDEGSSMVRIGSSIFGNRIY